jgi:hypothetical protein
MVQVHQGGHNHITLQTLVEPGVHRCYLPLLGGQVPRRWKSFHCATRKAKRVFFDACIEEISETNLHPWDLMEWVKQHKLPACKVIQYQGQPCHTLESLWDALHGTYNAAFGWQVDLTTLDDLDPLPKRDWVGFLSHKMFDMLSVCSSHSAPGPDHVTWTHLKSILPDSIVSKTTRTVHTCTCESNVIL